MNKNLKLKEESFHRKKDEPPREPGTTFVDLWSPQSYNADSKIEEPFKTPALRHTDPDRHLTKNKGPGSCTVVHKGCRNTPRRNFNELFQAEKYL